MLPRLEPLTPLELKQYLARSGRLTPRPEHRTECVEAEVPREPGKDELLTAVQMARVLNVHVKTIRRWVITGQITSIRVGHRVRFDRSDVLRRLRQERRDR